jgi:hypothetical protein
MRRWLTAGLAGALVATTLCAAAAAVARPVAASRCAEVAATPGLDPADPDSVRRHWRNGPAIVLAMGPDRHDKLRELLARGENPNVCLLGFSVLALAVTSGDVDEVGILLDGGADPNLPKDSNGGTPLLNALEMGRFDIAQLLIARGADVLAAADGHATALYELASAAPQPAHQAEQLDLARMLVDRGVPVDAPMGAPHVTALMMAAIRGNEPLVQLLLAHGADPGLRDNKGQTALSLARKKGHAGVVQILSVATSSAAPASSPQ